VILPAEFYDRDPRQVAVDLLGCVLVHDSSEGRASGVIVETEAYRPDDPACHAYNGPTLRNSSIFGPPGTAYVYLSYGMHVLLNAVCGAEGVGSPVLIRALRPLEGVDLMRYRRGRGSNLAGGPGRLTQALGVSLEYDGASLVEGPLFISWGESAGGEIVATTRVGISRGAELPWRYLLHGEESVSVKPKVIARRNLQRRWGRVRDRSARRARPA
jgi:DNA-3-methyladenine glycosylase